MPPKKKTTTMTSKAATSKATTIKATATKSTTTKATTTKAATSKAVTSKATKPTKDTNRVTKAAPKKAPTKEPATKSTTKASKAPAKTSKAPAKASKAPAKTSKAPAKASKAKADEAVEQPVPKASSKKRKADLVEDEPATNGVKKAKATHDSDDQESVTQKTLHGKTAPKKPKVTRPKVILNHAPTKRLNVYVFGANSGGELGIGPDASNLPVKRPRLNPNLALSSVGVVQVATGGMHCAALTHDNKILTWGVNDDGALGRDTKWDGGMVDIDAASDKDSETSPLNPKESTPTAIDSSAFPEGTVFTQLAASDSATFALTDEGLVYGWGSFRAGDGGSSFSPDTKVQSRPVLMPTLKKITKIATGNNHALALTSKGAVLSWGRGEQHELGRRLVERNKDHGLIPREFGLSKGIVDLGSGSNHSFAVHQDGTVYSWGSNNYGQTGIPDGAGEDNAAILRPTVVESLKDHGKVTCIDGGNFHSVAVTDKGECLVWGRVDNHVLGVSPDSLSSEGAILDSHGKPRIVTAATPVPGLDAAYAAAGIEHSLFVTKEGKVYSCGFGESYRTGQGLEDDIPLATQIDNTAIRGKKIVWAGAGGQFSVLAGEDEVMVNGSN